MAKTTVPLILPESNNVVSLFFEIFFKLGSIKKMMASENEQEFWLAN